ncbi:MAG: PD40 domain-containing protein [Bacteroidetes bacterium]|nr:PD40 domain-containing protein [Bacteroidota bacterium]
MRKNFIFLALIAFFNVTLAHTSLDAGDQVKMVLAKQKLYAGQYIGALNVYKEILAKNPDDAAVLYYIGLCNYKLNKLDDAESSLQKAIATNKNIISESYLLLGIIHLSQGKIDEASGEFNTYKAKGRSKETEFEDVDLYIEQCANAKRLMASPLDVKISNLGLVINSKYDDKAPCISADGRKLVFTTRRPETTDSPMDVEGDGKFFEDIYISVWDTVNKKWQQAESVPGNVNTDAHDAATSISPDGKQIFIYKNDVQDNESRGGDIFVSKVVSNKWKTPEPLGKPINTSYWEGGASISSDGKTLFFTSERKGGYGHSDIWMVKRLSKNEWDKPVNLGPEINSEYDEGGVFLAPDGKTLFFCSNGKGSMGSYDIFKTVLENGKWSKPVNLGYPINTEKKDGPFVLSADAQTGYFASDRSGGLGESDIYMVDLSNIGILEKDGKKKENNGLSILKGVVRDGFEGTGMAGADVTVIDESGAVVGSAVSNENGEYFFTLKGNVTYTVKVSKKGFKTTEEKVELKLGNKETYSLEKQFLLHKEK